MKSLIVSLAATTMIWTTVRMHDALASAGLPLSPVFLGATVANGEMKVEPSEIVYTGDGTGVLAGAHIGSGSSAILWSRWLTRAATGTGFNQLNDCRPSCAGGSFHGYRVRIEMWRPRTLGGARVFTRLTIWYVRHRPRGEPRHFTFTDTYRRGSGFGWGPPTAQGYCDHTNGLKPDPACKNIDSRP